MNTTLNTTNAVKDEKKGRKRAVIALGALLGVAALATGAAFTDFANLNLGTDGLGSADTYNIQVVGTDPTTGEINVGTWQEANTAAGVPIAVKGANSLFPGSKAASVEIPVRNASTTMASSLSINLAQIADTVENITDPTYLGALRFGIAMPATARSTSEVDIVNWTFNDIKNDLDLNELEGLEESTVTLTIHIGPIADPEAAAALNGKQAFLQAQFNGTSID